MVPDRTSELNTGITGTTDGLDQLDAAAGAAVDALLAVARADVTAADESVCRQLLGDLRRVRGWVAAAEAKVSSRITALAATEPVLPASDAHINAGGVSAGEARRKDRRAKTLDQADGFNDALASGRIDTEHVDALANATQQLEPELADQLFGRADELLTLAEHLPADKFARHCRDQARRLEQRHGIERNRQQRRDTYLSHRLNNQTGMIEGRFALHPELGNQIFGAINREIAALIAAGEQRGDREFTNRTFNRNQLAAHALGNLVSGGHQTARPLEADITVIVDLQTLSTGELHDTSVCETTDSAPLPPGSIRRLVCNGRVTPIYVDSDGVVLNAGRTIRHANRHQRRALRAMYRTCAVAGCDTPFDRCEIHHIDYWEHGGRTDLDRLLPLCLHHHHNVHDLNWKLDLDVDRTLTITDHNGNTISTNTPDSRPINPEPERHRQPAA